MIQRLAILASGNGTNAQRLMEHFSGHHSIRVEFVLSNRSDAYVLERARKMNIPSVVFSHNDLYKTGHVLDILSVQGIDWLILAGFLWLIPSSLLTLYPNRIINIHPALLPGYGGKGMYGMKVHQAVLENREKESGISIHFVNEHYDEGLIIFQARCPVNPGDTPETLAERIHQLEYRWYPEVVEKTVTSRQPAVGNH